MIAWDFAIYLSGLITMGYLACGLFFAKFWWRSRDLLLLAFAVAFWLMAADSTLLAMLPPRMRDGSGSIFFGCPATC